MATPPTLILENEGESWDTTTSPKTTAAFNSAIGDVWVTGGITESTAATTSTPTNTGTAQAFTARGTVTTASYCEARAWTTVVANTLTSQTVSAARTGATVKYGIACVRFSGSNGIGAVPAGEAETDGTAPSLTITTTGDNSAIVVFIGDFNADDGASRTWRTVNSITPTAGNGFELTYFRNSANYSIYVGYYPDAGAAGAKTVGLSAPTGMKASIVAVEVLGTAGGAAAAVGGGWFTSPLSELPWDESEAPWALRPDQPPIPLQVWTSPAEAAPAEISLTDTASADDALSVAAAAPLVDTGTATDALSVAAATPLADTAAASDALSSSAAVPLTDTATAGDALTVTTAVSLSDTASAADALSVVAAVPLTDTASADDTLAVATPISLTDTASALDELAVTAAVPLAELAAADDALAVTVALALADTAAAADALAVDTGAGGGTYVNHVTLAAARNGTTTHTVHPDGTGGSVVDGSAFTPTSGRLLLCFVNGSVTSTTPTGWTLPTDGSAINNTGLYVFHRTADGTSADQVATTHNASNYPAVFDFYEFPTGSTFVGSARAVTVSQAGGAGPTLSGLTGTNWTAGVVGQTETTGATKSVSWDLGVEEVDTCVVDDGATDGYTYGLTYTASDTASSAAYAATVTGGATTERLVIAVNAPAASTPISLVDTASADDALTVAAAVPLTDTASADDALSVTVTLTLADTATADDSLAVLSDSAPGPGAWGFLSPFAEMPFAAPAPWEGGLNKGVVVLEVWSSPPAPSGLLNIGMADTATADDALTVTVALSLADTATASESLTAGVPISLSDTATATDALSVTVAAPLADTASATDALAISAAITLTDTATGTDLLAVTRQLTLPETATATDALTLTATVPLADTASALDSLTISVPITLADVASATDALVVSVGVPIATPVRSATGHQFVRSATGEPMSRVSTGNQMFRSSTEIE